jgi:hypothetical protein
MSDVQSRPEAAEIVWATEGVGPLLERDYSAVIEGTTHTPEQVGALLRDRFETFAPPETALFRRTGGEGDPLDISDEMEIRIALLGGCRVRVVHLDGRSLTLRTLAGHPEAGRITFGADHDERDRLRFRILSRTRANGRLNYVGYLLMGKQMQARCWIRFIDRVAEATGGRVAGRIRVRTRKVAEEPGDRDGLDAPTFSSGGEDV